MSGIPKFTIIERNGVDFEFNTEYVPDVLDFTLASGSTDVTIAADLVTKVVWYSSATQIEANRIGQLDITYNVNEEPSTTTMKYYNTTNGISILKTVTTTYTWSASELTDTVTVIS